MSPSCPPKSQLISFAIGDLPTRQFERLAAHLTGCSRCESVLSQLDDLTDSVIANIRQVSRQAPRPETQPDHVTQCTETLLQTVGAGSRCDVSLDSGRHYSRLLEDGPCRLGRFELLEEIGVGSFGHVFRAQDTELDRVVAIKIQRAGRVATQDEAKWFMREARSAASLSHPAIVSLFETGETDEGVCFLVTELVEGETLERRLMRDKPSFTTAAELVLDLAEALEYAHHHGVVHRDVKPSNVIIDQEGHPHITDFGMAKRDTGDATLTSDGRIVGTPAYMSPEQVRGDSEQIDGRTDIYSLGVILYELLTGERPFHGTKRLMFLQVIEDEPRPPRLLDNSIPRDLDTICQKTMAKLPAKRYQSGGELAADLRRYIKGEPVLARPAGYAEKLRHWCRKYPLAAALLVSVSLGSVAGFAYVTHLSKWFVQETALDGARNYADMIEEYNAYYSDRLAQLNLDVVKVNITHAYAGSDDSLPLPATSMIEVGERISRSPSGMKVALFSPFSFRPELRPKGEFEHAALAEFGTTRPSQQGPESRSEYYEFLTVDGERFLRYARGQLMKASCIACHKTYEGSPKTDWEEGDLAGVLSITRPLERDISRTQAGLRGALLLMFTVAAALTAVGVIVPLRNRSASRE